MYASRWAGRGDQFVIATDDSSQRPVEIEGPDFIGVVLRHGRKVAPGEGRHPVTKWDPAAAQAARGANGEHFRSGKRPQRGSRLPFRASYPVVARQTAETHRPVPRTDEIGAEDGAGCRDRLHREERPPSLQGEGAAEVARGVEDGEVTGLRIQRKQGIPGPSMYLAEVRELAGSFSTTSPCGDMVSRRVEDPELVGTAVRHDDTAIGQHERVRYPGEEIGLRAFHFADCDLGLRTDPPIQPGAGRRTRVLDDPHIGAVAHRGVKQGGVFSGRPVAARGRGEEKEGVAEWRLHLIPGVLKGGRPSPGLMPWCSYTSPVDDDLMTVRPLRRDDQRSFGKNPRQLVSHGEGAGLQMSTTVGPSNSRLKSPQGELMRFAVAPSLLRSFRRPTVWTPDGTLLFRVGQRVRDPGSSSTWDPRTSRPMAPSECRKPDGAGTQATRPTGNWWGPHRDRRPP